MKIKRLRFAGLLLTLLLGACAESGPIEKALSSGTPAVSKVMANLAQHEVQILFTEVIRMQDGSIVFQDDEFGMKDARYHYPASTVKLPVALLALEKLQEDDRIDRYTRFKVMGEPNGSSFTNELIELFVVSDNQAYNRLFEFLGKDEINQRLSVKGLPARISHRLSIPDSDVLTTRVMRFSGTSADPVLIGPIENSPIESVSLSDLNKGVAYIENGEKINAPFDFSEKNSLPLRSLHGVMKRLMFPENFTAEQRFHLSPAHRQFVISAMQTLPKEVGYEETEFPDGYAKFLVFGDLEGRAPERLEIHNKSGWAYGYLTDTAYILNKESGREFIITASIHVNANQTFNDNEYEYEGLGVPFLGELGRQLIGFGEQSN